MKSIFKFLFSLCFALNLSAQTYNVNVNGMVTDINGAGVADLDVEISLITNNSQTTYSYVQTDADGNYSETVQVPNSTPTGFVAAEITDCDSSFLSTTAQFAMGSPNNFVLSDFIWCANPAFCYVTVSVQYDPNTPGATVIASATGTAPNTYLWSNGQTGQSISVTSAGSYCVTATDADGCESSACAYVQLNNAGNCGVQIGLDSIGLLVYWTAYASGTAPFTNLWSSGETTQNAQIIWGTNQCVTVTDAAGCVATACPFNSSVCLASISLDPAGGVGAWSQGAAPFTYLWSNGSTTASLLNIPQGFYCVTVTDANGCSDDACYQYGNTWDSCGVQIYLDSLPPGSSGGLLYANAWGFAPFSYQWSTQNASTESVVVNGDGTYCVTVTDATGCGSSDCITINNGIQCAMEILSGNGGLFAATSGTGFTYLWSTGETTASIVPTTSGTYCVTVTLPGTTCVATDCSDYQLPFQATVISGFVYPFDSLQQILFEGVAELYSIDSQTGTYTLSATTPLTNSPNGFANFYEFGQVAPGNYIVKILLDPNSPYFDEYLPTYHYSQLLWNEADIIPIPHSSWFFYQDVVLIEAGSPGGPGIIGGTITEGDGLVGHDDEEDTPDFSGNPVPNVSVLLLDEQEQPLHHDLTDANGQYSFPDLAWGTYKVVVEIVGTEQAFYWVTIGPDQPSVTDLDFEVTENGIVLGIGEAVKNSDFVVAPNPASSLLTLQVRSAETFEAQLTMTSATGAVLLFKQQPIARGNQRIELNINDLPSGVYFLNLLGGKEVVSKMVVKN